MVCAVVAAATALAFGGGTPGYEEQQIVEIPRKTAVVRHRMAPVTVAEPQPEAPPPPRMKPPIDP